jgi:hypothetical protein
MARKPVKAVQVWAIVDHTGEIRINQLRKTEDAALVTMQGWAYQGRNYRIVPVEIRPLAEREGQAE